MTLDDKAHIDEVVSELKALRLKYLTELNKTLALGEKVKAAYLRGEVDESHLHHDGQKVSRTANCRRFARCGKCPRNPA